MYMYRMFHNVRANACELIDQTKLSRKVLYLFVIFAIVNELLIIKNRRMQARSDIPSPSGRDYLYLIVFYCM